MTNVEGNVNVNVDEAVCMLEVVRSVEEGKKREDV